MPSNTDQALQHSSALAITLSPWRLLRAEPAFARLLLANFINGTTFAALLLGSGLALAVVAPRTLGLLAGGLILGAAVAGGVGLARGARTCSEETVAPAVAP